MVGIQRWLGLGSRCGGVWGDGVGFLGAIR